MSIPKYKLVVNAKDGENGIEITEDNLVKFSQG